MPASRATLALEQLYQRQIAELAQLSARLIATQYDAMVRPESLRDGIARFLATGGHTISLTKQRAQLLSAAFVRGVWQHETGHTLPALGIDRTAPATTIDGRPLGEALAAVAPAIFVALAQGRSIDVALASGRMGATRLAATEVTDAARREVADGAQAAAGDAAAGWVWVVASSGGCAACLSSADGQLHDWSEDLLGHPWCTCIKSPVPAGVPDRVDRPTGEDLFAAMTPDEQAATFHSAGAEKADLIASGQAQLSDMVQQVDAHDWRGMLVERPLADLVDE